MERNIYVDFDKNLITYNAPDLYSSVCANAAMLVKGDEGETYFLTDKGWYGTNETLSNFSYNAYTDIIESFFARVEPACGFYNMELGYTVTHDFTSDLVNPEDYYLLEQFDTTTFGSVGLYYYTAYYINKNTLLPDYVISQSFLKKILLIRRMKTAAQSPSTEILCQPTPVIMSTLMIPLTPTVKFIKNGLKTPLFPPKKSS